MGEEDVIETEMLWEKACLLSRLVAASVRISERAGQEIKRILSGGQLDVVHKAKDDIQTAADRLSQHCIVDSLRAKFGANIHIIGEEELEEWPTTEKLTELKVSCEVLNRDKEWASKLRNLQENEFVIWVDPLDGTNEFAQGAKEGKGELLEQVTVLIGIATADEGPVAGVIHQPYFGDQLDPQQRPGRTIWAIQGLGAFGFTPVFPSGDNKMVVTTRSHGSSLVSSALDALRTQGLLSELCRVGGAGYKVLRTMEGGASAYVFASPGCKKWDTCAPEAVLRAIGGELTDVHGNRLSYAPSIQKQNSGGVVATAKGVDHQAYVAAIPQEVKEALPEVLPVKNPAAL